MMEQEKFEKEIRENPWDTAREQLFPDGFPFTAWNPNALQSIVDGLPSDGRSKKAKTYHLMKKMFATAALGQCDLYADQRQANERRDALNAIIESSDIHIGNFNQKEIDILLWILPDIAETRELIKKLTATLYHANQRLIVQEADNTSSQAIAITKRHVTQLEKELTALQKQYQATGLGSAQSLIKEKTEAVPSWGF